MNELWEYLKRNPDALGKGMQKLALNPPLALAEWGGEAADAAGRYAGQKLRPVGAAIDAKLGTGGTKEDAASPDVFARKPMLPGQSEPAPPPSELASLLGLDPYAMDTPGLFEGLGQGVPLAAATLSGPTGKKGPHGGGFPTPAQSHAAMKDMAVLRDAMEAKGARAVESPSALRVDDPRLDRAAEEVEYSRIQGREPSRKALALYEREAERSVRGMEAAANANRGERLRQRLDVTRLGYNPDDVRDSDFYGVQSAAGQVPPTATTPGRLLTAAPNPNAKIPAEQTELERYLSGLFGPRAK